MALDKHKIIAGTGIEHDSSIFGVIGLMKKHDNRFYDTNSYIQIVCEISYKTVMIPGLLERLLNPAQLEVLLR